jgi:homoserine dehydrogenase
MGFCYYNYGFLNISQNFHFFFCRGIDLTQWKQLLKKEAEPADIDSFVHHLSDNHVFPNKVLVDCTADTSVASHYYNWLKKGIHVITPNKKANSGPLDQVIIWLMKLFYTFVLNNCF